MAVTTGNRFDVEFMPWETFFRAIMYPGNHSQVLRYLGEADLVIGGIDMSTSYLYVFHIHQNINITL
jgi:hypothetical protein